MSTLGLRARDLLVSMPVVEAFQAGARNAVRQCLQLQPSDRVALVVEHGLESIGAAFVREVEDAGATVWACLAGAAQVQQAVAADRFVSRVLESSASILVGSAAGLPVAFRRRLIPTGGATRRHLHLVGITPAMMSQGLRADYTEVERVGQVLIGKLKTTCTLKITTLAGTDLTLRCERPARWYHESGVLAPGGWTNLPAGELLTTPSRVDGVLVPDGGVILSDRGELSRTARLALKFEAGRLTELDTRDDEARAQIESLLAEQPDARRVGKVSFGTNVGLLTPIGAMLQDVKMPGVHLSLGDPYGELTGVAWSCPIEIPLLIRRPDVTIDDEPVMVRGKYVGIDPSQRPPRPSSNRP